MYVCFASPQPNISLHIGQIIKQVINVLKQKLDNFITVHKYLV